MLPLKNPCRQRQKTKGQKVVESPNPSIANARPSGPNRRIGFRPNESEAMPQRKTVIASAMKNTDSWWRLSIDFFYACSSTHHQSSIVPCLGLVPSCDSRFAYELVDERVYDSRSYWLRELHQEDSEDLELWERCPSVDTTLLVIVGAIVLSAGSHADGATWVRKHESSINARPLYDAGRPCAPCSARTDGEEKQRG